MKVEILELIYKNIFHERELSILESECEENGCPEVTRDLIRAYISVLSHLEEKLPVCLSGDKAETYLFNTYIKCFTEEHREYFTECWEWPHTLPTNEDIPKFILYQTAIRMSQYDKQLAKDLKKYARDHQEINSVM